MILVTTNYDLSKEQEKKRAQILKNEVTRESNTKKREKKGKLIGIELRDWMKKIARREKKYF